MAAQTNALQRCCLESFTLLSLILPTLHHLAFHLHLHCWGSISFFWGQLGFARYLDAAETELLCINSLAVQLLIPSHALEVLCFSAPLHWGHSQEHKQYLITQDEVQQEERGSSLLGCLNPNALPGLFSLLQGCTEAQETMFPQGLLWCCKEKVKCETANSPLCDLQPFVEYVSRLQDLFSGFEPHSAMLEKAGWFPDFTICIRYTFCPNSVTWSISN